MLLKLTEVPAARALGVVGICCRGGAAVLLCLVLVIALAGCGGGSGASSTGSTRAYVDSRCHEDSTGETASQRLEVVRGNGAPITVAEIPTYGHLPALGLCQLYGALRAGWVSIFGLAFQRLGVSPDGSGVVYEVNFKNSVGAGFGVPDPLTPDQEGIFFVRADGTGARRLGPPSLEPAQRAVGTITVATPIVDAWSNTDISFSPDGQCVTFPDRGPGPNGEDAAQVAILDIASATRTLVTRLPAVAPDPSNPVAPAILYAFFQDAQTIHFSSRANPDGLNPEGGYRDFTVKADGTALTLLPPLVTTATGGEFVPVLTITSPTVRGEAHSLTVSGTAVNGGSLFPNSSVSEIFITAPDHTLQLTSFGRFDTGGVATDGRRVFFLASANPQELGDRNPSENCQVFSISVLGDDLRQLTQFHAADHSTFGCYSAVPLGQPGCFIEGLLLDPHTQTLLFHSSCDPFGTNPAGDQIFAMSTDGTNLRQLTTAQGVITSEDGGTVDLELPGPSVLPF